MRADQLIFKPSPPPGTYNKMKSPNSMQMCNSLQPKHMFMDLWILRAKPRIVSDFFIFSTYDVLIFWFLCYPNFSCSILLLKHVYQKQQINFLIGYLWHRVFSIIGKAVIQRDYWGNEFCLEGSLIVRRSLILCSASESCTCPHYSLA